MCELFIIYLYHCIEVLSTVPASDPKTVTTLSSYAFPHLSPTPNSYEQALAIYFGSVALAPVLCAWQQICHLVLVCRCQLFAKFNSNTGKRQCCISVCTYNYTYVFYIHVFLPFLVCDNCMGSVKDIPLLVHKCDKSFHAPSSGCAEADIVSVLQDLSNHRARRANQHLAAYSQLNAASEKLQSVTEPLSLDGR